MSQDGLGVMIFRGMVSVVLWLCLSASSALSGEGGGGAVGELEMWRFSDNGDVDPSEYDWQSQVSCKTGAGKNCRGMGAALHRAAVAVTEGKDGGDARPTYADGSYALLIGVADYMNGVGEAKYWDDLPSIELETMELGAVLKYVHGFEVTTIMNPTGVELQDALHAFIRRHGYKKDARLLIFMAGHGWTSDAVGARGGRKIGWFVPRDAPGVDDFGAFSVTALSLRRVQEWSETMRAKHVLWVFDSCFSGQALNMHRGRSMGMPPQYDTYDLINPVRRVMTAGSENEVVPAESLFTRRLIDALAGDAQVPGSKDGIVKGIFLGEFLRNDLMDTYELRGENGTRPQNGTIVIEGDEVGDVVFRIEPELATMWRTDWSKALEGCRDSTTGRGKPECLADLLN